jgi:hypothetical protein
MEDVDVVGETVELDEDVGLVEGDTVEDWLLNNETVLEELVKDVELVEDTEDDVEETKDEVLLVLEVAALEVEGAVLEVEGAALEVEGAALEVELESTQAPAVSS